MILNSRRQDWESGVRESSIGNAVACAQAFTSYNPPSSNILGSEKKRITKLERETARSSKMSRNDPFYLRTYRPTHHASHGLVQPITGALTNLITCSRLKGLLPETSISLKPDTRIESKRRARRQCLRQYRNGLMGWVPLGAANARQAATLHGYKNGTPGRATFSTFSFPPFCLSSPNSPTMSVSTSKSLEKWSSACAHRSLTFSALANAVASGYRPYSNRRLLTAMDCGTSTSTVPVYELDAFPAPLVLPGDDIEGDPKYPPQNFREWLSADERNHVTLSRKVLYVAAPPDIDSSVEHMRDWQRAGSGRLTITVR